MILRRPYAFLIKHFRLIHLIMFSVITYIILRARDILNFFKDYINYNGNIEVISSNYINNYIFIGIFLIIVLSIVIYYLMRYKNKPRLFYIGTIIVSSISAVLFIYLTSSIKGLEIGDVSGREIRLFRDLSRINFWILLVSSIPLLIRGLGFDIKKFNFTSDLKELNLNEEDSAEVEVSSNLDSNNIKRILRKKRRELKYYYKENSLIINIIFFIIGIIIIIIYPFNKYVINRDLNIGETLTTNNFYLKINNSYISERNRISKSNEYLILNISIKGKINKYSLNLNEFIIKGSNKEYVPSQKYYNYFKDIGIGYKGETLSTEEYKNYILIYNIDNNAANNNLAFEYLNSNKKIKLNLEKID